MLRKLIRAITQNMKGEIRIKNRFIILDRLSGKITFQLKKEERGGTMDYILH